MKVRVLIPVLILASLVTFPLTLDLTRHKIGKTFPGYLTFKNGVVGAFYVPGWSGPIEGLTYHARPTGEPVSLKVFSHRDYFLVVVLPAVSGLLFLLLGAGLCLYLPEGPGRLPLLLFHFLVGNYLILSPEFQLTYHLSYLLMLCFVFIPAPMIHFALCFPEREAFSQDHPIVRLAPYLLSGVLSIPYVLLFMQNPSVWVVVEYVVVFYVIGSYLFWLLRLIQTLKKPHLEINRIIARYLLLGQLISFTIPLVAALLIFVGGYSLPMNFAAPLTLLFPLALFVGVILGRLRQSQMQLVQSEKRAALGGLLAGLAHEINNPMTFVYSAIEPLREALHRLRLKIQEPDAAQIFGDIDPLVDAMEEGATRARSIIDSFRTFSRSTTGKQVETDLNRLIEQSLILLSPRWKERIKVVRSLGSLRPYRCDATEMGQVFVNLIANACDAVTPSRGLKRPEEGTIEIVTEETTPGVCIRIRDNGCGMDPETRSRMFDAFYTTKDQGEGTGLGLAITLEIIKRHGGTIEVKSHPGQGSEFVIHLP